MLATLSAVSALLAPAAAHAQNLTLTLTPVGSTTLAPGGQLTLLALLSNTADETISLDGFAGTFSGPADGALLYDGSTFEGLFPLSLAPDEDYTGNLTVSALAGAPAGFYTFEYEVFGTGETTTENFVALDSIRVTVTSQTGVAVPEPGALALAVSSLSLAGAHRLARRRAYRA